MVLVDLHVLIMMFFFMSFALPCSISAIPWLFRRRPSCWLPSSVFRVVVDACLFPGGPDMDHCGRSGPCCLNCHAVVVVRRAQQTLTTGRGGRKGMLFLSPQMVVDSSLLVYFVGVLLVSFGFYFEFDSLRSLSTPFSSLSPRLRSDAACPIFQL
jgi:hypothetical protein